MPLAGFDLMSTVFSGENTGSNLLVPAIERVEKCPDPIEPRRDPVEKLAGHWVMDADLVENPRTYQVKGDDPPEKSRIHWVTGRNPAEKPRTH